MIIKTLNKKLQLLSILFLFISLISCNKDDEMKNEVTIENLVVTEISYDTAKVTWETTTNSEAETVYTVYLNQEVIVEQLRETTYVFENLTPDTLYNIKLVASNQSSNLEMNIEFRTLPTEQLYLRKATIIDEDLSIRIEYNDLNNIKKRSYFDGGGPNAGSNFFYNDFEQVRFQDNSLSGFHYIFYNYENQNLSYIEMYHTSCTGGSFPYCNSTNDLFTSNSSLSNYPRERTFKRFEFGTVVETIITNYTYEASYSDGKLASVVETNVQTGEVKSFHFEYLNGNLVTFNANGTILGIEYDDKKNWHTFISGYDAYYFNSANLNTYRTSSSLMFLNHELKKQLWLFPQLHDHININNPVRYSIDGETVLEFEYEYNIHDFPTKFTAGEYGEISLEYY